MCSHGSWNLSSWKCNSTLKYLSLAVKFLIYFSMRFFVYTDVKDLHMYSWPKRLNSSTEASVNASYIWFVLGGVSTVFEDLFFVWKPDAQSAFGRTRQSMSEQTGSIASCRVQRCPSVQITLELIWFILCRWRYLAASALDFIFQQGKTCLLEAGLAYGCITPCYHELKSFVLFYSSLK